MVRKFTILILLISMSVSGISAVKADGPDTGRPWKDHAKPYGFMFGNLIDNHQQMKLRSDGTLHGFIYIQFTGEEIESAPNGVPVARRADCTNPALDCRVGWEVLGIPVKATLLQRGPRLWELNPASLPVDPEYVHFHWYHEDAYNRNIDPYNLNPAKPCGLADGFEYDGYLFKRTAVTSFYWLGGNPNKEVGRLVTPGVDLHTNRADLFERGGDGGEEEDEGDCGRHDEPGH